MDRISRRQVETTERFYKIPKALFENAFYSSMKLETKLAYAILKDRFSLSLVNNWYDDQGNVFLYYSNSKLQEIIGYGKDKIIRIKKELNKFGLLEEERQGLNMPNRLYIGNVQVSDEPIYSEKPNGDTEVVKNDFQKSQIKNTGSRKNRHQEVSDYDTSDTEYSDTDINKTEINDSFNDEDEYINIPQSENNKFPENNQKEIIDCAEQLQANPDLRPLILDNFSDLLVEDPQTMLTVIRAIVDEQSKLRNLFRGGNTYLQKVIEKQGEEQGITFVLNQAIVSQIDYMKHQLQNYTYFAAYFAKGLSSRIQILCKVSTNRPMY